MGLRGPKRTCRWRWRPKAKFNLPVCENPQMPAGWQEWDTTEWEKFLTETLTPSGILREEDRIELHLFAIYLAIFNKIFADYRGPESITPEFFKVSKKLIQYFDRFYMNPRSRGPVPSIPIDLPGGKVRFFD